MNDSINEMSAKLTEGWNGLSKTKKIALGGLVGAITLGIGISVVAATSPQMEVLYSNLSIQEAAQVVEVLDTEKISYELSNGGQTIKLNAESLDQAKILLARENIPQGKYTFKDALDNSMSTTESEKNIKLHKLKETELETALESIGAIDKADVTLVIPKEKNSFVESTQQSSASVLLSLNDSLSTKQIEGIARLISNSVEKLDMKDINIVDANGNTLFQGEVSNEIDTSSKQDLKATSEKDLTDKVKNLLSASYDDVRVSPNLIFNFDSYAEAKEEYTPVFTDNPRGMINSEKTHDSSGTTSSNADGGVPGTTSNAGDAPTNQIVTGDGSNESSQVAEKDITYLNNKIVTNLTKDVGTLDMEKSSVAIQVYVNKVFREADAEQQGVDWIEFKELNKKQTPIEIDEATTNLIRQATGLQNVAVQGFEKPVFIENTITAPTKSNQNAMYLGVAALIGAIGAFLIGKARRNKKEELEIETDSQTLLMGEENAFYGASTENKQDSSYDFTADEEDKAKLENIRAKKELETKTRIEKFAEEKPEIVANLLRNWLTDEDWEDDF